MGVEVAVPRRINQEYWEILDIADVTGFTPTTDPDQGDTNYGLGQGDLYQYADPDDGAIVFQSSSMPNQGDYILSRRDQGGYRYNELVTKETFEGTYDVVPPPA